MVKNQTLHPTCGGSRWCLLGNLWKGLPGPLVVSLPLGVGVVRSGMLLVLGLLVALVVRVLLLVALVVRILLVVVVVVVRILLLRITLGVVSRVVVCLALRTTVVVVVVVVPFGPTLLWRCLGRDLTLDV